MSEIKKTENELAVTSGFVSTEGMDILREALDTLTSNQWKGASLPDRWDGRTAERIVRILLELT